MSKVTAARIQRTLIEDFNESDRDSIIEDILNDQTCPCCHQPWPKKDGEDRERVCFRISKEQGEKLDKINAPSTFLSGKLMQYYGYCPWCSQKKKR